MNWLLLSGKNNITIVRKLLVVVKCIDICRHFDPSIYTYQKEKHQYRRDLIKDQPAYIVEAPFESSLFASQGRKDCAVYIIKEMLDAQRSRL